MSNQKSIDVVGCQAAVFEWAESYDTKDWERLAQCVTPTLHVSKTRYEIVNCNLHPTA